MTAPAQKPSGVRARELVFPRASAFLNFVLTCAEEPALAPGSDMYERCLDRVSVERKAQTLHVVAHGPDQLVRLMEQMALANEGTAKPGAALAAERFQTVTIGHLLRAVRLRPVRGQPVGHMLIVLWGGGSAVLLQCVRHLWEHGARGVEVAFVQPTTAEAPTHCVRAHGLRHAAPMVNWARENGHAELYVPADGGRQEARFYVQLGFEFPAPGLGRLAVPESELVLLRPREKTNVPQWLAFAPGQVDFFRKPNELFDVRVALGAHDDPATRVTELNEDAARVPIPLEVAVVPRPRQGSNQVWVIDGEIDRQRRVVQELEQQRARLASGGAGDVYFAYRFDQKGTDRLNPLLSRFLQQRLATLAYYDYAYCSAGKGQGYHLVVANRTHRQLGFALQSADSVFYQPAAWRQWGVNLFLPGGAELAPRVDSAEAIPLLQALLEKSAGDGAPAADFPAILWEPDGSGGLRETRVAKSSPLLDQYRLLNSFQRAVAGEVAAGTRKTMAEALRKAREGVAEELDGLERELLTYYTTRTTAMEEAFTGMETQVKAATELVDLVGPKAAKVSAMVLDLPKEWVGFVNRVIKTHREIADPAMKAAAALADSERLSRDDLKALAARNRDLVAAAHKARERLREQLVECEREVGVGGQLRQEVEELAGRVTELLKEVSAIHARVAKRVERVKKDEEKADKMQKEVDQIGAREEAVKKRLAQLQPLYDEVSKATARVAAQEAEATAKEEAAVARSRTLTLKREELRRRIEAPTARLEAIERDLELIAERSAEVEEAFALLGEEADVLAAHADVVRLWSDQRASWDRHAAARRGEMTETIRSLGRSIPDAGERDAKLTRAADLLAQASAILNTFAPATGGAT